MMKENETRAWAEIDLDAIVHNLEMMHEKAKESGIVAVVKANAYGNGAVEIAKYIEDIPYVHGFAVATADEAFELRDNGIKKPIMLLGLIHPSLYGKVIKNDAEIVIVSLDQARELSDEASRLGKDALVQIAVDTGMNRIGNKVDEAFADEIKEISSLKNIIIKGIFTHFYLSDAEDKSNAKEQLDLFLDMMDMLDKRSINIPFKHCSNSAAILEFPDAHMDLVRAGIAMYGLYPSFEVFDKELDPVMSLYARVTHIKKVHEGESISYGATFTADRDMTVATIGIGYGDGYPRQLSNKGSVLINGKRCKILGRVCMDQFMVDISDAGEVNLWDEAVLIGPFGIEIITMEELGGLSGRFNYELSCMISNRVPRVYIKNGKK